MIKSRLGFVQRIPYFSTRHVGHTIANPSARASLKLQAIAAVGGAGSIPTECRRPCVAGEFRAKLLFVMKLTNLLSGIRQRNIDIGVILIQKVLHDVRVSFRSERFLCLVHRRARVGRRPG